ncbi:hypothetical protein RA280_12485 [Cupriavidus sp. CV2]|uniref:hypothetical protein n=1 Tax=Cupriavidus ulmosensis TaxID=3065913 RepID=UPI00296A9692|nr:hypothetical protein [Cupriavidus sp. CV2]MDW3682544.1 hypothetical protein [Cupriavidus sp. CV2]
MQTHAGKTIRIRKALMMLGGTLVLAPCAALMANQASAQSVEQPAFKEGDSWTMHLKNQFPNGETRERSFVSALVRSGGDSILVSTKPVDSSLPPKEMLMGLDWSQARSINGHMQVVNKPLSFPMKIGKTWTVSYDEDHPNPTVKQRHTQMQYKVIGWEDITVPAGKFQALKIETDGTWYLEFQPTPAAAAAVAKADQNGSSVTMQSQKPITRDPATGRIYRAYWYVPSVKRTVKIIEEQYNSGGGLSSRDTLELESYRVDTQAAAGN